MGLGENRTLLLLRRGRVGVGRGSPERASSEASAPPSGNWEIGNVVSISGDSFSWVLSAGVSFSGVSLSGNPLIVSLSIDVGSFAGFNRLMETMSVVPFGSKIL